MTKPKQFNLTREQALKVIGNLVEQDGWEYITEEFYDEKTDSMPSIYDVLRPLGITQEEFDEAVGAG